ncbi:hypothetical protein FOPE_01296 [Fonsecaea pedrosoi]|nr:hypothetical protein FOPE_01296 [Fonsecaea pedrosoi]
MPAAHTNGYKRPIIIGNVAGGFEDAPNALYRTATEGHVDALTGDWLAELNIAWQAIVKHDNPKLGYEPGFLDQLDVAIDVIAEKKIKVVTTAGALNTAECARQAKKICEKHGHKDLVVAYVEGDDISDIVTDEAKLAEFGGIRHLDHVNETLADWERKPHCGVAYFGAWGICEALRQGADIVICGRVTDASPVIGLAAWWHNWAKDDWDALAGALVAGHLIECGCYATGANFSGFKHYLTPDFVDLGFPLAEIAHDGTATITKHPGAAGFVDQFNVRAQLVYEIQGNTYLNTDVCADITNVEIRNEPGKKDRVLVSGAKGSPPPPTTKAIVAAIGGWLAEATFYMNGLDIDAKEKFMRQQLNHAFRDANFLQLSVERYGTAKRNPSKQAEGTVMVRVLAQARNKEDIDVKIFKTRVYALRMQFYPGYHMSLDFRTMSPRMFMELFPGLISVTSLPHRVVFLDPHLVIDIPHPKITQEPPLTRPSADTINPVPLERFGPTRLAPLGAVMHGRSGDKGDNSNVGLFVRSAEEFEWLRSFMTTARFAEALGDDLTPKSRLERCEFPRIWAVHFRILDFLGGGGASTTRIDSLGKGIAEYVRSREMQIPEKFLKNPISEY